MGQYRLTLQAEIDFDGIGEYSLGRWGYPQAEKYLSELDAMFVRLAESGLGRDVSEIKPDLLAYPCNEHMIYFRRDDLGNVQILRILNQRMNPKLHI